VNVRLSNGTIVQARSYFTGTAADGSTFVLMLSPLFNLFFDTTEVNEINAGNFRTNAMNMSLYPNTFLFNLNQANPNAPGGCCVLGFHTYFANFDGLFPQQRFVSQFASWISPGLFGAGFQDVTALSHELAETFANPFISNPAPNWQFPGEPANAAAKRAQSIVHAKLPPDQARLEIDYKRQLRDGFGIEFHNLYTLTNMPISRFAEMLHRTGEYAAYLQLLVERFNPAAVPDVMCRSMISIGWDGVLYDCDFNQMLEIGLHAGHQTVFDIESFGQFAEQRVATASHCFGCTAGAGSSCGGALR